jgi:type II secretory pathway pseudopilin PulG
MKKSFTIIETLVAITIFTLGVVFLAASIWQSYSMASQTTERFMAIYLAQEGLEIVKNLRSENYLSPDYPQTRSWNAGLDIGDYEADYKSTSLTSCGTPCNFDNLRFLNLESSGFYSYSNGTSTPFKRKISISYPEENKMEVTVKVYWQKKGAGEIEEFSITEHLYNWNQ